MAIHELGNIKNSKGNYFKVHWNDRTYEVWISSNIEGPWHLRTARTQEDALKIAKEAVENIE